MAGEIQKFEFSTLTKLEPFTLDSLVERNYLPRVITPQLKEPSSSVVFRSNKGGKLVASPVVSPKQAREFQAANEKVSAAEAKAEKLGKEAAEKDKLIEALKEEGRRTIADLEARVKHSEAHTQATVGLLNQQLADQNAVLQQLSAQGGSSDVAALGQKLAAANSAILQKETALQTAAATIRDKERLIAIQKETLDKHVPILENVEKFKAAELEKLQTQHERKRLVYQNICARDANIAQQQIVAEKAKNEGYETQLRNLRFEATNKINSYEVRLAGFTQKWTHLQSCGKALEVENQTLQARLADGEAQFLFQRDELARLQKQVSENAGQFDAQCHQQLKEKAGQLEAQYQQQLSEHTGQFQQLQARNLELETSSQKLEKESDKFEKENFAVKATNKGLRTKCEDLERQVAFLVEKAEKCEGLKAQINVLEAQKIEAQKDKVVDAGKLEADNQALQTKSGELEAQVQKLKVENQDLKTKSQALETKNHELEAKNKELETKSQDLDTKSQDLDTKNKELQTKSYELETKNKELDTKSHELEKTSHELKTKNEDLQAKSQELEAKNKALEVQQPTVNKELEAEATASKEKAKELESQNLALQEGAKQSAAEITAFREKAKELEARNVALQEGAKQLEAEKEALNKAVEKNQELKAQNGALQERARELEGDSERLEVEKFLNKALDTKNQELKAQNGVLQKWAKELEGHNKRLEAEKVALNKAAHTKNRELEQSKLPELKKEDVDGAQKATIIQASEATEPSESKKAVGEAQKAAATVQVPEENKLPEPKQAVGVAHEAATTSQGPEIETKEKGAATSQEIERAVDIIAQLLQKLQIKDDDLEAKGKELVSLKEKIATQQHVEQARAYSLIPQQTLKKELKNELKNELKQEIKEELKEELSEELSEGLENLETAVLEKVEATVLEQVQKALELERAKKRESRRSASRSSSRARDTAPTVPVAPGGDADLATQFESLKQAYLQQAKTIQEYANVLPKWEASCFNYKVRAFVAEDYVLNGLSAAEAQNYANGINHLCAVRRVPAAPVPDNNGAHPVQEEL